MQEINPNIAGLSTHKYRISGEAIVWAENSEQAESLYREFVVFGTVHLCTAPATAAGQKKMKQVIRGAIVQLY